MNKNINCIFNSKGAWCTNKEIKRSLWGFGARCCIEYYGNEKCPLKEMFPKPEIKKPGGIKINNKEESDYFGYNKAMVIHIGGLDMQICIPRNWNDNQVRDYANKNNPCGTRKGWQIRRKGDPLLNGAKERTPCKSDLGHKVHIMLDA